MTDGRDEKSIETRRRRYDGLEALEVSWNFDVRGGTYGVSEAAAFAAVCDEAGASATPLVTRLRSRGTRLQEGMRALVGIPRAALALRAVADAGVPHIAVAEHPTTGGVWVALGAVADVRAAVAGATVGFSGPRVVEAMLGRPLPPGANTAESAAAAGLVDAVVAPGDVDAWLASVLRTLVRGGDTPGAPDPADDRPVPERRGWAQVEHSRRVSRPSGAELIAALAPDRVPLRGGDDSVAAALGDVGAHPAVVVAAAATRAGRVTPAGYALLTRCAQLAGRLDRALVTLVDTAGADPLPASEDSGVAAAIAAAMTAVLDCPAPTVAVVHGEGGSGGALAAAVCDVVAVTADGWFAALGPEGAAAALRTTPPDAADLMRVAPVELVEDGFADAVAPGPEQLPAWLASAIGGLRHAARATRREHRRDRWSQPLSGPRPRLFA